MESYYSNITKTDSKSAKKNKLPQVKYIPKYIPELLIHWLFQIFRQHNSLKRRNLSQKSENILLIWNVMYYICISVEPRHTENWFLNRITRNLQQKPEFNDFIFRFLNIRLNAKSEVTNLRVIAMDERSIKTI